MEKEDENEGGSASLRIQKRMTKAGSKSEKHIYDANVDLQCIKSLPFSRFMQAHDHVNMQERSLSPLYDQEAQRPGLLRDRVDSEASSCPYNFDSCSMSDISKGNPS